MAKYSVPSSREHPPGKTVGGQHCAGPMTNHGGGYGAGGSAGPINRTHPGTTAPPKK